MIKKAGWGILLLLIALIALLVFHKAPIDPVSTSKAGDGWYAYTE